VARWIRIAETSCNDPSREAEFNEWYDNVHIPHAMKSPLGVISATRYERMEPREGQGKYIVVYEIETDDMEKAMEAHTAYGTALMKEGQFSDLLEVVAFDNFRQMGPSVTAPPR